MIQGICNVPPQFEELGQWPHLFVSVPNKEDVVESSTGVQLRVVSIIHCFKMNQLTLPGLESNLPFIKVVLSTGIGD